MSWGTVSFRRQRSGDAKSMECRMLRPLDAHFHGHDTAGAYYHRYDTGDATSADMTLLPLLGVSIPFSFCFNSRPHLVDEKIPQGVDLMIGAILDGAVGFG